MAHFLRAIASMLMKGLDLVIGSFASIDLLYQCVWCVEEYGVLLIWIRVARPLLWPGTVRARGFHSYNLLDRWCVYRDCRISALLRSISKSSGVSRYLFVLVSGCLAKGHWIDRREVVLDRRMECLLAVGFIGLQNFVLGRPLEGFFVTRTIVATLGAIIASLVRVLEGFRVISGRHDGIRGYAFRPVLGQDLDSCVR